jgi:UDP-N-acetylmuramate-alanine ligase
MNFKKAHFIDIAGKGMSAPALPLREMGVAISGSDEGFYPSVSDYLKVANNRLGRRLSRSDRQYTLQ